MSDLSTVTSNPVTNPIDLLTEGALSNAASTAIPEVTGGAVPTYDVDLAQDLLAASHRCRRISRACWAPTRRTT
ncbi:MAG: hypothetical protein WA622_26450 [Mycobacterium sp.]|uniref:hypothetical protein n=1 Tax=Mycobacterium sp. TaxID=1785 RepID=UPI003BB6D73B